MENDTRTAAFLERDGKGVGGLKLRGFSLGALNIARDMGLTYVVGTPEEIAQLSEGERNRQIIAFAWAQSAPIGEVLDAVANGSWRRFVDVFSFDINLDTLPAMLAEIQRVSRLAVASSVETVDRSNTRSEGEQPPPN